MEPINGITPNGLWTFIIVLVGLCIVFNIFGNAIKTFRDLRKPNSDSKDDVSTKLHRDKERLDMHTMQIDGLMEYSRVQCAALIALLDHELHNGNADQMQKARDELSKYLINKK